MTESDARAAVLALVPSGNAETGQKVLLSAEFPHGWLLWFERADGQRTFGGSTYVVDEQDGAVRAFTSALSPGRLAEEYPALKPGTAPLSAPPG